MKDINKEFLNACKNGNLDLAKNLLETNPMIEISFNNDHVFQDTCSNGHLNVAKWLLEIKPTINISANNEEAFRSACKTNKLDIVKWLLEIKPTIDISANNENAFRSACRLGNINTAKWLSSLNPDKYKIIKIEPEGNSPSNADKSPVERLSLNRSQCGGCSTKYNTLTET